MTLQPIDVVILTWNDGELLETAIDSAIESEGVEVTVFVIDNGSDQPVRVPPDANIRLEHNQTNHGVASGRNQGVALGEASMVCLLDSDAELAPHSLVSLLRPFEDPSVGVAVPIFSGQLPESSAGATPTLRLKLARGLGLRKTYESMSNGTPTSQFWDVEFGIGACQVFRRSAFEKVGGLDASIFYGPEDVDFCLRVRDAGYRVVQVAGADVIHPPRRAFRNPFSRRGFRHGVAIVAHFRRRRRANRQLGTDGSEATL